MKKIFLSLFLLFFATACSQPSGEQTTMFSEISSLSHLAVTIQVHALDEDTFAIQVVGISESNEVQGMDAALELPEGVKVTDIKLNQELKDKDWMIVKNLEKQPVLVTSIGTEKITQDMDVLIVDVEGKSTEKINVYVSILEHGKSYGEVYPFSFPSL